MVEANPGLPLRLPEAQLHLAAKMENSSNYERKKRADMLNNEQIFEKLFCDRGL